MPYLVVTTRQAMIQQARDAYDTLRAKGLRDDQPLREAADVDRAAFSKLIEAFVALGQPVSQELKDLAGLRSVEEILGE